MSSHILCISRVQLVPLVPEGLSAERDLREVLEQMELLEKMGPKECQ